MIIDCLYAGAQDDFQTYDPILIQNVNQSDSNHNEQLSSQTHRLPMFPTPLTIAMAADLLAGGRGITLETQTAVSANPTRC